MKLSIQNLTVRLQEDTILRDVSLDIHTGEFLSLLGPSGCGKTTLLKTIAGLRPIQAGRLLLDGEDISNMPTHKRGTVIVFQDHRLFPHMNLLENVAYGLKMQGIPKDERLKTAAYFLKMVQLEGYEKRRVTEISGGQMQRVALARALASRPKLLLLDEPFSALDENLREEMRVLVRQLHEELGMTTIIVTHDRAEALSLSDRIAVMFDGQILQVDAPRTVYHAPAHRRIADYFGDRIYLSGKINDRVFTAEGFTCPADLPDGCYDLLLRPDVLSFDPAGDYVATIEALYFAGLNTRLELRGPDGLRWQKNISGRSTWKKGDAIPCRIELDTPVFFPVSSTDCI